MGYNFFVNDLGFNKLVTTQSVYQRHLYQRSTAAFRKDQFDASNSAGDQSLTGWWTRGQLSFHRGAGVKYYEVTSGDDVLNRYLDSDGVDPLTPGQVSLLAALGATGVAARDVVPGSLSTGGGAFALTASNVQFVNAGGTQVIATSDGGAPSSITSSGQIVFCTNGAKLEIQSDPAAAKHNYVPNPSFENPVGVSGWTSFGHLQSFTQDSSPSPGGGSYGARFDQNAGYTDGGAYIAITGLTVGASYKVQADIASQKNFNQGTDARDYIRLQMATTAVPAATAGTYVDTTSASFGGKYATVSMTRVAQATTEYLHVRGVPDSTNYLGFWVDKVMVVEAPYAGAYFDGSSPGAAWSGTPQNSVSVYATIGTGSAFAVLATLSAGTWAGAWWAKGRVWAVDSAGSWYTVLTNTLGQTVDASTAPFWKSGITGANWSFTDSPGPTYISNGTDVYAVTVDTDGSLPTLGTPTTAAQVPLGETISCIAFYLTYLVLATTRGVRVVLVNGTQAVMGGVVVKGDFTATRRIGLYDTKAYVAGRLDGRNGATVLCALDLAEQINELQPAWAPLWTLTSLSSNYSGCVLDPVGTFYVWAADTLSRSGGGFMASGSVTTGYHRYGTLDNKLFYSVLVRSSGLGSILVERVEADGSTATLGTVSAGSDATLPLGMPDPAERVALRFTLTPDSAGVTPILLGYQLKALPSPERQRMIQVPLMLFDHERTARGRATGGDPWARLAALEALEVSNALVSFRDEDTGETGTALIEEIDVTQQAPPSGTDRTNGFGGLLTVTLRKL